MTSLMISARETQPGLVSAHASSLVGYDATPAEIAFIRDIVAVLKFTVETKMRSQTTPGTIIEVDKPRDQ
jgi:hypothetical protein